MIRYTGRRLDVQHVVDAWIKERRRFNVAVTFVGEIHDLPTGEVVVNATAHDGRAAHSVGIELAKWLRSHTIPALP